MSHQAGEDHGSKLSPARAYQGHHDLNSKKIALRRPRGEPQVCKSSQPHTHQHMSGTQPTAFTAALRARNKQQAQTTQAV